MTFAMTGWAVLAVIVGVPPSEGKVKADQVTLTGTVTELTSVLKSLGVAADPEPIAKQVALVDKEGAITPLLSDDASRAFFLDARMRDREVKIRGRRFPGLPYLQVLTFQVAEDGKFRTPEYYCEICTISVRYPQICPCCQGPMVLRMKPEDR